MPRTRRRTSAPPPARCAASHLPRGGRRPAGRHRRAPGRRDHALLRSDDRQADRLGAGPAGGAGAARGGAGGIPGRRHHDQPRLPARGSSRIRRCWRPSSTPASRSRHAAELHAAPPPGAARWRSPPPRWRRCCRPTPRRSHPWDRRDGWRLQGAGSRLVVLADGDTTAPAAPDPGMGPAGRARSPLCWPPAAGWRPAGGAATASRTASPVLRDGDAVQVSLRGGRLDPAP